MVYRVLVKTQDGKIDTHECEYANTEEAFIEEEAKGNTVFMTYSREGTENETETSI